MSFHTIHTIIRSIQSLTEPQKQVVIIVASALIMAVVVTVWLTSFGGIVSSSAALPSQVSENVSFTSSMSGIVSLGLHGLVRLVSPSHKL